MNKLLFLIPVFLVSSVGFAYAEPLSEISTKILDYDGVSATIEISWNYDAKASKYEVGCVSCSPNTSEFTTDDNLTLTNVTSLSDGIAILYALAYDLDNNIISAQQVFVNLK